MAELKTRTWGMLGREYRVFGQGNHYRIIINNILENEKFHSFGRAFKIASLSYDNVDTTLALLDSKEPREYDDPVKGTKWERRYDSEALEEHIALSDEKGDIKAGTSGVIFQASGPDTVIKLVRLPTFDENNNIVLEESDDFASGFVDLFGELALSVNFYQAQLMKELWNKQQKDLDIPEGLPILQDYEEGVITKSIQSALIENELLQDKGLKTEEEKFTVKQVLGDVFPLGAPYAMWEMEYIPLTVENEWGGIGPDEDARWELPMWKLNRATNAEAQSFKEVANYLLDEFNLIVRDARNPGNVGYRLDKSRVEPVFFDLIVAPMPGSIELMDDDGADAKMWDVIFGRGLAADHAYQSYLESIRHCYHKTGPRCRDGMTYAEWRHQFSAFDKQKPNW